MAFVKRKPDQVAAEAAVSEDCAFARDYPAIWEYLTMEKWDDGDTRETSTLLMLFEDGCFKACLNDRALGRSAWTTADSPSKALQRLDNAIQQGSADWRAKKQFNGPKRR